MKMNALTSTGYLLLGLDWPFQLKPVNTSVHGYEDDLDDDSRAKQEKDDAFTYEERQNIWDEFVDNLQCAGQVGMRPVLLLATETLFMILGMPDARILNDLIFLDYLTTSNYAFYYMASVLHHLSLKSTTPRLGKSLELPTGWKDLEFWKDLISNAGDAVRLTET